MSYPVGAYSYGCVMSFTFLMFENCIVENGVACVLSTCRQRSRGKRSDLGSPDRGCWSPAARRILGWQVSGVLRPWGRRKGSKGRLASFLGSRIRRRGKEIPREFYLFDVCFMLIQKANTLCSLPSCCLSFDQALSEYTMRYVNTHVIFLVCRSVYSDLFKDFDKA